VQPLFRVERAVRQLLVGEAAQTKISKEVEGMDVEVAALEAEMATALAGLGKEETPELETTTFKQPPR
jgi:hypothetical protein